MKSGINKSPHCMAGPSPTPLQAQSERAREGGVGWLRGLLTAGPHCSSPWGQACPSPIGNPGDTAQGDQCGVASHKEGSERAERERGQRGRQAPQEMAIRDRGRHVSLRLSPSLLGAEAGEDSLGPPTIHPMPPPPSSTSSSEESDTSGRTSHKSVLVRTKWRAVKMVLPTKP